MMTTARALGWVRLVLLLTAGIIAAGCERDKPLFGKDEATAAVMFLGDLSEKKELPWLGLDEKGRMNAAEVSLGNAKYPFQCTFHFKKADGSTCYFTTERATKRSPIKLIKAWRVDSKENIIAAWPQPQPKTP